MSAGVGGWREWVVSAGVGCAIGIVGGVIAPTAGGAPVWLCAPFVVLLLAIAVMPLAAGKWWHSHYPSVALALGALVLGYCVVGLGPGGRHAMLHAGTEYYSFIALVGGLYVASGGVLVEIGGRGTPLRNTLLLGAGAVLANVLGTTGASVLLIRPFMRMNRGRMRAMHAVFFIFIVSNCGGCLTPIGDPPLYLGYLKGVPFAWTITHLWPMWLMVNGVLLGVFFMMDVWNGSAEEKSPLADARGSLRVSGAGAIVCLLLLVAGVFVDPMLKQAGVAWLDGVPVGATFQIAMAVLAYVCARREIHRANQFTFEPVKEVAFLFAGIFLTMAPALGFLQANAGSLGLQTPTQYYFLTGGLSAGLDNAPTYLSFLQTAAATLHVPMTSEGMRRFIETPSGQSVLVAISLGAVFFGAMTYIGNGPNFMVKSIVDSTHAEGQKDMAAMEQRGLGAAMPSFVGYVVYAAMILLPVLVINWLVFIR